MNSIKIPSSFKNSIKQMQKSFSIIFVSSHAGTGKTSVVRNYLDSKNTAYTYISARQKDFIDCIESIRTNIVVIDDFQGLLYEKEEYLKEKLYDLLRSHKFILLSRADIPAWLKVYQLLGQVGYIEGNSLYMTEQEVREYFLEQGIAVSDAGLYEICSQTERYSLALKCLLIRLKTNLKDDKLSEKVLIDIFDYYDEAVIRNWSNDLYFFVRQIGGFERFSVELASMITGNPQVQLLIDEAHRAGNIFTLKDDEYITEPFFRKYLLYKQKKELSKEAINNIYYNAGLYYELHSDIQSALLYYSMCHNMDKIKELLIRDANLNPGLAHYLEVEDYYRSFDKETILSSPDLISGMCMLCSLNMQVEESEYWYDRLKQKLESQKSSDYGYKYIKGKLYWLDISLPHRGSANIDKLIINAVTPKKNRDVMMQDISVTSNLPSVLNGGKDFSCWVNKAELLYPVMKPIFPIVLGKAGEGLADLCVAEKMLEQGDDNTYKLMDLINHSIHEASTKGCIEVHFVGIMLMHRLYMAQGNAEAAYQLITEFKERALVEKQSQIIPNLNAAIAFYNLRTAKNELAEIWLKNEAPNETIRFNIFERYRYMVKARCLILQQKYMEAMALLNRLIEYAKLYDRTIVFIQAKVLMAIVLHRTKDANWNMVLEEALAEAKKYGYIRMIAEEGAAILPLLQDASLSSIDKKYKNDLLKQAREETMMYPSYLKLSNIDIDSLTATEKQVLKLIGRGLKNKEIGEFLGVSLNTVAYHTKNIYQKLNVNNRSQATNIAKTLEKGE